VKTSPTLQHNKKSKKIENPASSPIVKITWLVGNNVSISSLDFCGSTATSPASRILIPPWACSWSRTSVAASGREVMTWGTREIAKPPRTWKSMTSQVGTTNFWRHEMGKYFHTKCLWRKTFEQNMSLVVQKITICKHILLARKGRLWKIRTHTLKPNIAKL